MEDCKELISVIVPYYNNSATIRETIESVQAQTYQNWELICVDDGSEDSSNNIVELYVQKDSRIFNIKRTRMPKGGSVCRNVGLANSHGKYIVFLDADDLLSENCLEKRYNYICHTDYKFVAFPMAKFTDDVNDVIYKDHHIPKRNHATYLAGGRAAWQITSPLWKRDYLLQLDGFNESFMRFQDIELHLRAVLESNGQYEFYNNEKPDCYYRIPRGFTNNAVISKKQKALETSCNFINLIHKCRGKIGSKISYSALSVVLELYYMIDTTPYYIQKHQKFEEFSGENLCILLNKRHNYILNVLNRVDNTVLHFFLVRCFKKILNLRFRMI